MGKKQKTKENKGNRVSRAETLLRELAEHFDNSHKLRFSGENICPVCTKFYRRVIRYR